MVSKLDTCQAAQVPTPIPPKPSVFLPSELKDAIASFCSNDALAILALTNREFNTYAERCLYHSILVETYDGSGIAALATLVANPSKAKYVKVFGIDFYDEPRDVDTTVLRNAVRALPAMSNLQKIRIRLVRDDLWDCAKELDDALW